MPTDQVTKREMKRAMCGVANWLSPERHIELSQENELLPGYGTVRSGFAAFGLAQASLASYRGHGAGMAHAFTYAGSPCLRASLALGVSGFPHTSPARTGVALSDTGKGQDAVTMPSPSDEAEIKATMAKYNAALNDGNTAAVLPLYTEYGIFMPPFSPSAIGQNAIRKAYDAVFAELRFDVKFNIAELVQMAPTWAYVRTNSAGTTDHASTGKTTSEANQELFIFEKGNDRMWRIARYSFSPTQPLNAS